MAIRSIYHKTDEFGSFSGDSFHANKEFLKESDEIYVISSKQYAGQKNVTPYLEGHFKVEKQVPPSKDNGGKHLLNDVEFNYKWTLSPIVKPNEPVNISFLQKEWDKFSGRFLNQTKPNLTNYEIERFKEILSNHATFFLSQPIEDTLLQDLYEITQSDTERSQQILARIGQGKFRQNVVSVWGLEREMCVLTGIALPTILTASHIVPWSECNGENAANRWDGANGILLCAHIDRLFDQHYLSFR
jgi:hypothetical protein